MEAPMVASQFLPVVGLRLHAKVPPVPLSQAQLTLLCGLWHRKEQSKPSCTSLQQAAPLTFGPPLPFREMTNWEVTVNEQAIDIGEVSKQHYSGGPPEDALPVALTGSAEWASWVLSLAEVWQDDAPMQDRPLEVHCSGLGGIILPNSSRVSMLTYQAIVAVRYPELVLHESNHIYIGHFVPHESTVAIGGFRTVLWKAPKDLRSAVEDVVAFCTYLKNYYRNLQQGATSQLLVLCNRTAVHKLLLQHGFQTEWYGGLRVSTTSSAAGATTRIAVIVQTGVGFLGRRDSTADEREDCYGRATVALTRAIDHTYIVSPLDMVGLVGMAQTLQGRPPPCLQKVC